MRIIETRGAPNPRRLRMFVAEKNLILPFEERDLMRNELKSPQFAALNPMMQVPVLILDDGTVITESIAICRYLDSLHPEPPLFGQGALGTALVEMWNRRMELGLFFQVAQVFRHLHPRMAHLEVPQVADWGEANRLKAVHSLAQLNERLAERPFVAGPDFTVADITAFVAVGFMKPAKIERPAGLDHVDRWFSEVSARPSAAAL